MALSRKPKPHADPSSRVRSGTWLSSIMAKILGKVATRSKQDFFQFFPKNGQAEIALTFGSEIGHPAPKIPITLSPKKILKILSIVSK
jgi:hypothetical protein